MSIDARTLQNIVEGALLAAAKPLSIKQLLSLFEGDADAPKRVELEAALAALAEELGSRGIELKEVSSGYRLQVKAAYAHWIGRLWEERPQKYSRAMLETLSLIAYRQPITRGEIEDIRGVAVSSNIIRALSERDWVRVVGHKDVPGRPAMYATTRSFLDYFNLQNLDELPSLSEIRDLDAVAKELNFEAEVLQEAKQIEQRELEREQRLAEQEKLQAAEDERLDEERQQRKLEESSEQELARPEESELMEDSPEASADKGAEMDGKFPAESANEPSEEQQREEQKDPQQVGLVEDVPPSNSFEEMSSWDLMAEVAELDVDDETDIDENTDRTSSPATLEYPPSDKEAEDAERRTFDRDDSPTDGGEPERDRDPGFDLLAEVLDDDELDDADEPVAPNEQK
ncbi:segregation and condensation protein B [Sinobacterium caligoides]|uniref:Segregation and condensation protein B n=1 Tax=Sinobacterium caligoides TaxID=933926 RepID=A0A3N2DY04_9GAMM|nr:SMC-Scp complex subunit ScpB [Sinobacterium caligoides]ROS04750.1 segregation and condensation protein B [Sinobacterium caligoides]